ncbi:hypothetical protein DVH24_011548 [Malus domestica]|uniref:Protein kinase domain-containing protein n=1 Tax=Malus domestica TaxID=3750 RepID=A0A498JYY1_MALDO|nr:hypothetical protein DVH24_011548 [Malus domestica]
MYLISKLWYSNTCLTGNSRNETEHNGGCCISIGVSAPRLFNTDRSLRHMVAHVSDFGISKLLGEGESTTRAKTLVTIGYMAPGDHKELYLHEVMFISLKSWVIDALNGSIIEAVDGDLLGRGDENYADKEQCLYSIFSLSTKCTLDLLRIRLI